MKNHKVILETAKGGLTNNKVILEEESVKKSKTKPLTKKTEEGNIIEKKKIGRPKLFKDDIKFKVELKKTLINFD